MQAGRWGGGRSRSGRYLDRQAVLGWKLYVRVFQTVFPSSVLAWTRQAHFPCLRERGKMGVTGLMGLQIVAETAVLSALEAPHHCSREYLIMTMAGATWLLNWRRRCGGRVIVARQERGRAGGRPTGGGSDCWFWVVEVGRRSVDLVLVI